MCNEMTTPNAGGYERLLGILKDAFEQGSSGKGHVRHAYGDEPWHKQITAYICKHRLPFAAGQAVKKIFEAQRLSFEQAIEEYYGAINYICFEINRLHEDLGKYEKE